MENHESPFQPAGPEVVDRLVQAHRDFLAFLESRLHDREAAEDLLQSAFVRAVERGGAIRDQEQTVSWFYRLLRNALTDHWRRRQRDARGLAAIEAEGPEISAQDAEEGICACLRVLLPTLKPGYAEVLERIDLRNESIATVAGSLGITPNNATVRLHRARQAIKRRLEESCGTCATHSCLDCDCGGKGR